MKELKKDVESKMKIRFPDCDPFNHLNNSRYIDYIINAREDQLLEYYDFNVVKMAEEKGVSWVTAQTQISYLLPAYLMEEVIIQTRLISYSEKSILLEALMWNNDKTLLKAVMWSKQVHYNLKTKKSQRHSSELMEFFDQIVSPMHAGMSFDERIKGLKTIRV